MSIISSDAWARSTRARLRSSLLLGLAAALIVSIAGGVVLLSRPTTWTAHASLVVLPAPDIPAEAKAGYYETLGEGHVVATLGEILRNQPVAPPAAAAAGLSERERSGTKLQVQVVPGTSLIRLTVSADSPLVAERWADAVAATGVSAAAPFSRPYVVSPVGSARGTATRAGASPATLLALVAVLAAASALAVQS